VCALKHYAADHRFLRYMNCRGAALNSDDWAACTGKATGIDKKVLERCATGAEGAALLEASFERASASEMGASPTWLANSTFMFNGLDPETLKKQLCGHNTLKVCAASLPSEAPQASPAKP
jgi:hypothetical protein